MSIKSDATKHMILTTEGLVSVMSEGRAIVYGEDGHSLSPYERLIDDQGNVRALMLWKANGIECCPWDKNGQRHGVSHTWKLVDGEVATAVKYYSEGDRIYARKWRRKHRAARKVDSLLENVQMPDVVKEFFEDVARLTAPPEQKNNQTESVSKPDAPMPRIPEPVS